MNNYPDGMKEEDLDRYMTSELDEEEDDDHEDVEPDYEPDWDYYERERYIDAMADRWYKWLSGPEG